MRARTLACVASLVPSVAAGAQRAPVASLSTTAPVAALDARDTVDSTSRARWRAMTVNQRVALRLQVTGIVTLVGSGVAYALVRTARDRSSYRPEEGEYGVGMFGGLFGATVGASVVGGGTATCGPGARAARGLAGAFLGTIVGAFGANAVARGHPQRRPGAALLVTSVGQTTMATLLEGDC